MNKENEESKIVEGESVESVEDLDVSEGFEERANIHRQITVELYNTYVRKNHDYGESFRKTYVQYGDIAPLVRMEDKLNRMKALMGSDESLVEDESFIDTLKDFINYGIIWLTNLEYNRRLHELGESLGRPEDELPDTTTGISDEMNPIHKEL